LAMKSIVARAEGLSCAEICRAVDGAIKEAVMHNQALVKESNLNHMLEERRLITGKLAENKRMKSSNAGSARR
jgi:hypothetical protein